MKDSCQSLKNHSSQEYQQKKVRYLLFLNICILAFQVFYYLSFNDVFFSKSPKCGMASLVNYSYGYFGSIFSVIKTQSALADAINIVWRIINFIYA